MIDQKVAIVTSGSSGIGRATAVALAKQGVKVTVAEPFVIKKERKACVLPRKREVKVSL
jgi:NAD(P)-dependent dehydrogenase (short-subunit alcohol dehydrogenase family)